MGTGGAVSSGAGKNWVKWCDFRRFRGQFCGGPQNGFPGVGISREEPCGLSRNNLDRAIG